MSTLQQTVQARRQALIERGGARFDDVGLRHVQRLCERAEHLPERAEAHLLQRALQYLTQLEQRFDSQAQQTAGELSRLQRLGLDRDGGLQRAYDGADFTTVRRIARRHPWQQPRAREDIRQRWEESVDAEAEKRGLSSPGMLDAVAEPEVATANATDRPAPAETRSTRPPDGRRQQATVALAMAIYRDAAASTSAKLAIRRARRSLPPEVGRYHATSVSTRALQALQTAPSYLEAQLARLEVAALLEHFGTPPPKPASARAARKRKPKAKSA